MFVEDRMQLATMVKILSVKLREFPVLALIWIMNAILATSELVKVILVQKRLRILVASKEPIL